MKVLLSIARFSGVEDGCLSGREPNVYKSQIITWGDCHRLEFPKVFGGAGTVGDPQDAPFSTNILSLPITARPALVKLPRPAE